MHSPVCDLVLQHRPPASLSHRYSSICPGKQAFVHPYLHPRSSSFIAYNTTDLISPFEDRSWLLQPGSALCQCNHSSHIKCLCKRKQTWKVTSSLHQEGGFSDMLLLLINFSWDFFQGRWLHCLSRLFYIPFLAHPDILFAFVDCCGRDINVCWTRPVGWICADVLVVKSCALHYLLSISQAIQFSSEFSFYGCNK